MSTDVKMFRILAFALNEHQDADMDQLEQAYPVFSDAKTEKHKEARRAVYDKISKCKDECKDEIRIAVLKAILDWVKQDQKQQIHSLRSDGGLAMMCLSLHIDPNGPPFHILELDCCGRTLITNQDPPTIIVEVGEIKSSAPQASDAYEQLDRFYQLLATAARVLHGKDVKLEFTGYLFLSVKAKVHSDPKTNPQWKFIIQNM